MNDQNDVGNSPRRLAVTPLSVLKKLHAKYLDGGRQDGWGFLAYYESQVAELSPDCGWFDANSDNATPNGIDEGDSARGMVVTKGAE